jgi:hypothetical protein
MKIMNLKMTTENEDNKIVYKKKEKNPKRVEGWIWYIKIL